MINEKTGSTPYVYVFLSFIAITSLLVYKGVQTQAMGFYPDIAIHIFLLFILYVSRKALQLRPSTYLLVAFAMLLHDFGIFGWYNVSPVPMQWDHITHLFGGLSVAVLFFDFFKRWMTAKAKIRTIWLIAAVFFASLGMGALVEVNEFWGYLKLGEGEGMFMFGPGDSWPGVASDIDNMNFVGGGWINEGWDLTFNIIGILAGIVFCVFRDIVKINHSKNNHSAVKR
ncbi:MAG: hypothetical protein QXH80_02560 [Candidatus Nanoarchaeia archaeon]